MFEDQKFLTRGVMADIPSWLANLFKECLSTHTKNKILNTLARECQCAAQTQPALRTTLTTACASTNVPYPLGG